MSATPELNPQAETERLDAATDQAISVCDGDMRSAISALILANEFLESRNVELARYVSVGFVRGQLSANNKLEDSFDREIRKRNIEKIP